MRQINVLEGKVVAPEGMKDVYKRQLHTIDPAQAGFSATERFSADRHLLPFFIYHQDINGIRVYVGFYVVRNERIFDSVVDVYKRQTVDPAAEAFM